MAISELFRADSVQSGNWTRSAATPLRLADATKVSRFCQRVNLVASAPFHERNYFEVVSLPMRISKYLKNKNILKSI